MSCFLIFRKKTIPIEKVPRLNGYKDKVDYRYGSDFEESIEIYRSTIELESSTEEGNDR